MKIVLRYLFYRTMIIIYVFEKKKEEIAVFWKSL